MRRHIYTLVVVAAIAVLAYDGLLHAERRGAAMLFVFIGLFALVRKRRLGA